MRINADFSRRAVLSRDEQSWIASPAPGVDRIMLDRIGDEVARATSIVRYAAGSRFERHEHAKGEEFLVLEGVFSDESGDYPAGTYVRNPPGSGHSPFSEAGCTILVKLRQFSSSDLQAVVVDTLVVAMSPEDEGRESAAIHEFADEVVSVVRLMKGYRWQLNVGPGGFEVLLVSGSIEIDGTQYSPQSWARLPAGDSTTICACDDSFLWTKSGHLPA